MSPLFKRMLVLLLILFGVIASSTSLLTAYVLYNRLYDEYISTGQVLAKSIANTTIELLLTRDAATLQSTIDQYLEMEGTAYVYVVDTNGNIVTHTFVPHVPEGLQTGLERSDALGVRELSLPGEGNVIDITAPVLAGVAGHVHVGMDKDLILDHAISSIIQQQLLLLGIFGAAVVFLFAIVNRVSRPLTRLTQYAERLSRRDFSEEIEVSSRDEIGILATTMRSMARELHHHFDNLETAVAEATSNLRSSNTYLRAIMDNLADGLLVTDIFGRVSHFNPALVEMFDLGETDLTGHEVGALFPQNLTALSRSAMRCSNEVITEEVALPGGRIGKAAASCIVKSTDSGLDRCMGVVVLIRDITAEKEIDRMKTDFISTVSHELRTPLTSVLGFAKIIRKRLDAVVLPAIGDNPADPVAKAGRQIDDNLEVIVREGQRLTELINDVLDISKMESGRIEWHMQLSNFKSIVDQAVKVTAFLFEEKDLACVVDVEPNPPPVLIDRDRMVQVLVNLLANAVKFTEHGSITIRVRSLDTADFRSDHLLVSVIDTGPGIRPENQELIFQRFKQVGDTLTDKPRGSGLGLPICKQIVETHGGRIWVESESGLGSTFRFTVPIDAEDRPDDDGDYTRRDPLAGPPLILVVDDDESILSFLRQFLEDEGYRVAVARNGHEALAQARKLGPDVITMDIMMPGMDGAAAIVALRRDERTRDIPIIVLTALSVAGVTQADAALVKPVDEAQLLEAVAGLLGTKQKGERACLVVTDNGMPACRDYLMLCPGQIAACRPEDIHRKVAEGFEGTIFVTARLVSSGLDLARIAESGKVQVVIIPD
jgi:PAS domain S-box-containing protein